MWEATRPPQSAIGELWGESWKHDPPLPIPVALVDAVEKVEEWYARLQYTMSLGTEPFASGWANSKRAFNLALAETKNGIDPTNGSTWFVALGRTQRPNESREQFQQRFWADYEREAREFSAYAAQNPNFAWSITPAESVIILSGGAEMIAVITGTAPCVYTMECNP